MKVATREHVLAELSKLHFRPRREEVPGPETCDAHIVDWVRAQSIEWNLFGDLYESSTFRDWYYAGWLDQLKPFVIPYFTRYIDAPPEGLAYGVDPKLEQLEAIDDLHYRAFVMWEIGLKATCERSRALILSVKDDSVLGMLLQANLDSRPPPPPGPKIPPYWYTPPRPRSRPDWTGFRFWEPGFFEDAAEPKK
jgi:hypothetical protein